MLWLSDPGSVFQVIKIYLIQEYVWFHCRHSIIDHFNLEEYGYHIQFHRSVGKRYPKKPRDKNIVHDKDTNVDNKQTTAKKSQQYIPLSVCNAILRKSNIFANIILRKCVILYWRNITQIKYLQLLVRWLTKDCIHLPAATAKFY